MNYNPYDYQKYATNFIKTHKEAVSVLQTVPERKPGNCGDQCGEMGTCGTAEVLEMM